MTNVSGFSEKLEQTVSLENCCADVSINCIYFILKSPFTYSVQNAKRPMRQLISQYPIWLLANGLVK